MRVSSGSLGYQPDARPDAETVKRLADNAKLQQAVWNVWVPEAGIRFAKAPSTLAPNSHPHPIGSCSGYAPLGCRAGYASSDIFFLEACFYSMMCSNRDQLFWVEPGADWECNLDRRGFERMRDMILRPKK